jgi:hypothetical protein
MNLVNQTERERRLRQSVSSWAGDRIKVAIFFMIAFASLAFGSPPARPTPSPESRGLEAHGSTEAVASILAVAGFSASSPNALPSSFVYGGQPSGVLLPTWQREDRPPRREDDRTIYETTWREPDGGLVAT